MKKNKKIIFILIMILLIFIVIGVVFFKKAPSESNKLSFIEEITFNEEEKEILEVLRGLEYKLQHPELEEDNEQSNSLTFKPAQSVSLKEFISKIYELRKKTTDNGETCYIIEADTIKNDTTVKRFIIFTKENLFMTINDDDIDYNGLEEDNIEQNEDGGISMSFGKSFYEAMIVQINQQIQEQWDNAKKFNNVNYNKLLKSI